MEQWARYNGDPIKELMTDIKWDESVGKLPPVVFFYGRAVDERVMYHYREELDTLFKQTDPEVLHQIYREPYGIAATAALLKAIREGD